MQIILIGINHKTAPVDIRQQLAFDTELMCDGLKRLKETYPDCEFSILSTCNRIECYAVVNKVSGPKPVDLAKWLTDFRSVDFSIVQKSLYIKRNEDVVRHLFTVSSGLDSMVIGENQIAAQVKECYKIAARCKATGKVLNHLFHDAFRTTKQIVTKTSISKRRVSVAGVAVEQARQIFSDIRSAKVVIVGAGQMGELLIEHFRHEKCRDITVVNRSEPRGCRLAQEHAVTNKTWQEMDPAILQANILVGAASTSDGYLFTADRIKTLLSRRRNQQLLMIDIAVPRSIDPAVGNLQNVYLYNIDDLAQVAEDNIKLREGDLERAIEIICEYTAIFMDWYAIREVGPLIGQIKKSFEQIREIEMDKFFDGPRQKACCRELMESSMSRVVNKLCHCVINNIEILSKEQGVEQAEKFAQSIIDNAEQIISVDKKNIQ